MSRKRLGTFCGVVVSMDLPIPLARFYTRSLYDALCDWSRVRDSAARGGERTRLSNRTVKDLKVWLTIDRGGRLMQDHVDDPALAVHTDGAELGAVLFQNRWFLGLQARL